MLISKKYFAPVNGLYPYSISCDGVLKRGDIIITTPIAKSIGYKRKYLKDKHKNILVHRLVAETFIPNPENKPCVNHIDGNKLNNHVSNLEWVTKKENSQHASKNNLLFNATGQDAHKAKLDNTQVIIIRDAVSCGYKKTHIARYFNINRATVSLIIDRKTWKCL